MAGIKLQGRRVVVVAGSRTPFLRSGTEFSDLMAYQLGTFALNGLLERTKLDPAQVDRVVMGTVLSDPRTSNVAREMVLAAGWPSSIHAHTVTAACTSANVAIAHAVEAIAAGAADVVIAGGTETLSDLPIRFRRPVRQRLLALPKARSLGERLRLFAGLGWRDWLPETPAIAEFTTGLTMGENAEMMAKRFAVSRESQDQFSLSSHRGAASAQAAGWLAEQIVPVAPQPGGPVVAADNGVRGDSSLEKLARLPAVFDRKAGSVTAGNASFLTDGAAAVLLMAEERAERLGFTPLARVSALATAALDPKNDLLLGPAASIPRVLDQVGLTLDDIEVVELHEAFAAQVLANVAAMADADFCRQYLGRESPVGALDLARVNAWGGSLAIGHPFGATGARLVTTAAQRLKQSGARWALVSACAAGGLGSAMVLERCH